MNDVCSSSLDIEQILNDSSTVLSSSDDIGELIQVFNSKQSNRYYYDNKSYSTSNSYNEGDNTRSMNAAKTGRVLPNEREKAIPQTNNTTITTSIVTKSTRAMEAVRVEAAAIRIEEEGEEEEGHDSDHSNSSQDSNNNNLDSPLLQLSSLSEDDSR